MLPLMKTITAPAATIDPTDTISSIFTARRDLLQGVKFMLADSGFTIEEADLLTSLYGVRELQWADLAHDDEGYVAFKALESFLVHNPSLLSRRIRKLADAKPPLVEVAKAGAGQHFNALRVRITEEGTRRIRPVWERFSRMSANLVKDIPQPLLEAHLQVNELLNKRIRERRQAAMDFTM
jgi:signal transduction histidine kinase